ncbi:hypothetical protein [Salinimicrobium xinjiangense]|uniref:hypothetical protein n=1 Tax=Salinimicrobium xinjiangense TaxID=438596 RepID=UPI00048ED54B|nr:hypothetical protein [Salinimicrobium xinjiangense]
MTDLQLYMNSETSVEEIISLIEQGDPVPILAQDSFVEVFNELLKYQLIDLVNDKVVLTPKGKDAKEIGFSKVLFQLNNQEELKDFSRDEQKKESYVLPICVGLSLTLIGLFVVISLTNCTSNF